MTKQEFLTLFKECLLDGSIEITTNIDYEYPSLNIITGTSVNIGEEYFRIDKKNGFSIRQKYLDE